MTDDRPDPELMDALNTIDRLHTKWTKALAKLEKAERSLKQAGFTDCGGELWTPPLGPKPDFAVVKATHILRDMILLEEGYELMCKQGRLGQAMHPLDIEWLRQYKSEVIRLRASAIDVLRQAGLKP